jgi:uroporphyrinogen-III synthase
LSEADRGCVLITRPEPGAQDTASRLRSLGFAPLLAPMLTIQPGRIVLKLVPQAVLVTSANAIAALPPALRGTKLLAVGDATAERARAAGFLHVESAGRDAEALAALVALRCPVGLGPLLLASGAGQGMPLAADLRARGFTVHRRIAYRAAAVRDVPQSVISPLAQGGVLAAMFFSPATARAFVACMMTRRDVVSGVEALAISQPTARALSLLPWRRIRVASQPNQDELVALLT